MPRFLRQFGLRTLLLFCTLAAVCFGLWRWHMTWVDHQHDLAQQIADKRGDVRWQTWGPAWLHDWFGSYYFSQIVAIDWKYKRITDKEMQLLREITSLEQLYVPGNQITNQGIEVLADLPRLRRLAVWRTRLTDKGLETIGKLRNLEALDVHATEVTEKGFRHLRGLPKLKLLRHDLQITNEGIEHFKTLPSLELETLKCHGLSEANMRWVANQSKLVSLWIADPQGDRWADMFIGHPALEWLDIGIASMSDQQLKKMLQANTLFYLTIHSVPVGDESLVLPPSGGKLRGLVLQETNVTSHGFLEAFGTSASNICIDPGTIELHDSTSGLRLRWYGKITSDSWQRLAKCTRAKNFVCGVTLPAEVDPSFLLSMQDLQSVVFHCPIDDRVLHAVGRLPHLTNLTLTGEQNITPAGLGILAKQTSLENLQLANGNIGDEHLAQIGKIHSLMFLRISQSPITDEGVAHLTSLQKLGTLQLIECYRLNDEAMKSVAKLSKLHTLNCSISKIGDAGLKHLHGMPSLFNVYITGSQHTRAGLDALRDSLPNKGGHFW